MEKRASRKDKQNGKTNTKVKKSKKPVIITLITLCAALLVSYGAGVFYFTQHPIKSVMYDGQKINVKTFEELAKAPEMLLANRNVSIAVPGSEKTYDVPLTAVEPTLTITDVASKLKTQQNPYLWPVQIFTKKSLDVHVEYTVNGEVLKQRLTDVGLFDNSQRKSPEDAAITIKDGKIEVTAAKQGTQLDEQKTFDKIQSELQQGVLNIDVSDCVIPPVTSDEDVAALKKDAESIIATPITLKVGTITATPTAAEKASFLAIDNKEKKITINETSLKAYLEGVNQKLAESQNATGTESKVEFGDGVAKLITNASDVKLMDVTVETKAISEAVLAKKALDYAPALTVSNADKYTYVNKAANIAKTSRYFIEVSIPKQTLFVYEGDKVIRSAPIVTGNESAGRGTIRGLFSILSRETNKRLVGNTVGYTGANDYNLFVNYWIPFESSGYGLHDAEGWRAYEYYGGDYYYYGGSHGCVNMRLEDVAFVYEHSEVGTPVWVHD